MDSDHLLALFMRGLVPGPSETEEAFIRRVESHPPLPFPEWKELANPMVTQCGFHIDWVPITYSSKKLLPWEGAVFWVEDQGQSLLQLKPALQSRKLWGNSRMEILMHEAVHAAREAFNEPQFEEFLAYTTALTPWKRWIGPFFVRAWEFPLMALALFLLPLFPWLSISLLLLFVGRFLTRLFLFERAKKTIPFPILICLTDREIRRGEMGGKGPSSPRLELIDALKKQWMP